MTTFYAMRANNHVLNRHVYWVVLANPDPNALQSGFNPSDLDLPATVDYSGQVPIAGEGGVVPGELAGGDLGGSYPDPSVAAIGGVVVSGAPATDQALTFTGSAYHPVGIQPVFNVKTYGAVGNGVADDTTAVNNTITAAGGSGTIVFPPGTYNINSNISFPAGVKVRFDAGGIIRPSGSTTITLSNIEATMGQQIFDPSSGGTINPNGGGTPAGKLSVKWWGAKGDGSTDDTNAIQALFTTIGGISNNNALTLHFPAATGFYKITSTLLLSTSRGAGINIEGPGIGLTPSGAWIQWHGAVGGIMMECRGLTNATISNITFDGNFLATTGLWIHSNQGFGGAGSSGVRIDRCTFTGCCDTVVSGNHGSSLLLIGETSGPEYQTDTLAVRDCFFQGCSDNPGFTTGYGFNNVSGANAKDYLIEGCQFASMEVGIFNSGGDNTVVRWCGFGSMHVGAASLTPPVSLLPGVCILTGGENLTVMDCASESGQSSNAGAPKFDTQFLADIGIAHTVGSALLMSNNLTTSTTNLASGATVHYGGQAVTILGNYSIIQYGGRLSMIGNIIDGSGGGTNPVSIGVGNTIPDSGPGDGFFSLNNCYRFTVGAVDVFDGSSNSLTKSDYANVNRLELISFGDMGGDYSGSSGELLKPLFGMPTQMGAIAPFLTSGFITPGVTARRVAEPRTTTTELVIPYTLFVAHGARLAVCQTQAGTKVRSVIAKVTTAFSAPSGTITIKVGYDDGINEDNYLQPFDATSINTWGLVDGDLGNELARATLVQGGGLGTWLVTHYLVVNMGGTASTSALTAGSLTIYLTTELLIS